MGKRLAAAYGSDLLLDVPEGPRAKPIQREWKAQEMDESFLEKALPPDAYRSAIDQAGKTSPKIGQLRRKRGIRPGIADWLIVYRGITLWIERKAGSSLSDNQLVFRDQVTRNGHHWRLARSTEEVELACRDVGIPLRATLGDIRERIQDQQARLGVRKKRRSYRPRKPPATAAGLRFGRIRDGLQMK